MDQDTRTGDGGNGVHAINNAVAANTLDPVTGQFQTGPIAQDQQLGCELP